MRITARLDRESESNLAVIQQTVGLKTVTDVVRYSLQAAATQLEKRKQPGDVMRSFLASDYVASFDGPEDLSANIKQQIAEHMDEKYLQQSTIQK